MVQKKLPLINSEHGSETRNIINELIKLFNSMGYSYDEALSKAHDVLNEARQTNDMNKNVQEQINTLIAESGTSDAEVLQARTDLNGYTHDVLKQRLDYDTSRLDKTELDNFNTNTFLEMPENYLEIPSAIGSSLTTHPSVIDFLEEFDIATWNGYRYWMAHTPYPGTQNENPSIAASNDNVNWILPTGAPNPVINAPVSPAYNSDTELIYLTSLGKLRMYYREANNPDGSVVIYYIESTDGSNWTAPVVSLKTTTRQVLSPSVVPAPNNRWFMYCVESQTIIHRRESSDGITWGNPDAITQPWENWSAWHIGVTKDSSGKYHMLGSTWADSASGEGTQFRPIVYASSENGRDWTANEKPQLIPTGWAGGYLYRPHFIVDESKGLKDGMPYVKVWFSAAQDAYAAGWHIGYTEGYLMNGDINPSATSEKIKRKRFGEYFKVFASNIIAPFAKIARIGTKRIEITGDYSQPLVEFRDGRVDRNGGNNTRIEYLGGNDPSIIRFRTIFNDNEGNQKVISLLPFQDTLVLPNFDLIGVKQLRVNEVINSGGIRSYMNDSAYNRIATNTAGATQIQLSARGKNYVWEFRSGNGALDGGGNILQNIRYIQITQPTSISNAPNGALFEDADGKLKYKNRAGELTVLTP